LVIWRGSSNFALAFRDGGLGRDFLLRNNASPGGKVRGAKKKLPENLAGSKIRRNFAEQNRREREAQDRTLKELQ